MPVVCLMRHKLINSCTFWGIYPGPLSVLISWGMPKNEKAWRKCFIASLAFSPLWADVKMAPESVTYDTCKCLYCPNDW